MKKIFNNMPSLIYKYLFGLSVICLAFLFSFCKKDTDTNDIDASKVCENLSFIYNNERGCNGLKYPDPNNSLYILPFEKGKTVQMGLCNCSSSYHASGQGDQYAFDFNMDEGTPFHAARGGIVHEVIEDQASIGGGSGNWLVINHGDQTSGIYLHSPKDGIYVEKGDTIKQGQIVGEVGRSGLAGYSHLHFIVVSGDPTWPYRGVPVSFKNAYPADVVLKTNGKYTACEN